MPSTMPKKNWYKPMTLVTRLTVTASSSNDWKPSFSSIVATGSRPPYGVRFLPRKSYGVEALILLGSGITSRTPCLAGFRRVCCFLLFTIWVAPENRSAKLQLRVPTVLTQDSQGLQMDALPATSFAPQPWCIIQVKLSPSLVTAHLYLATAYMQMWVPDRDSPENTQAVKAALDEYRKTLELDPKNDVAIASIASIHPNQKQWDLAWRWYERLIAIDLRNADAYYSLGYITWSKWYPAYASARANLGMQQGAPGPIGIRKSGKS